VSNGADEVRWQCKGIRRHGVLRVDGTKHNRLRKRRRRVEDEKMISASFTARRGKEEEKKRTKGDEE